MAPTVILIGGRARHEFTALRELGARIVYLDERVSLDCVPWVDVPVDVDLEDWDTVAEVCARHSPDAVLTHLEPWLPLMARLAEKLHLPHRPLSVATARNCRDKLRTRDRLRAAGVPCPNAGFALTPAEARDLAVGLGFPVVVKPRDGAGGLGVRLCADAEEVERAANVILGTDSHLARLPGLIVEEYVDGPEFAVQAITTGGNTRILTVLAQHVTEPPVFVELGYDHPSGLSRDAVAELTGIVSDALRALDVTDWISHTQVRSGPEGFRVIEVNARRPGGRLVDMTAVLSGVDMVDAAGRLALGLPVAEGPSRASHAAYRSVAFREAGMVLYDRRPHVDLIGSAVPPIVEIDVPPGHPVLPVTHPDGGVYGRLVVFGDSPSAVEHDLEAVRRAIGLQVLRLENLDLSADRREFKPCC